MLPLCITQYNAALCAQSTLRSLRSPPTDRCVLRALQVCTREGVATSAQIARQIDGWQKMNHSFFASEFEQSYTEIERALEGKRTDF